MTRAFLMTLLLAGAACAMPSTTVRTGESRPSLAFSWAPADTTLYLDGQAVGPAASFDGQPAVLNVEPGTHDVEIRRPSGETVFRQRIFVESGLKTIEVH